MICILGQKSTMTTALERNGRDSEPNYLPTILVGPHFPNVDSFCIQGQKNDVRVTSTGFYVPDGKPGCWKVKFSVLTGCNSTWIKVA